MRKSGLFGMLLPISRGSFLIVQEFGRKYRLRGGRGDSALDHTPEEHISLEEYGKAVTMLAEALRLAIK